MSVGTTSTAGLNNVAQLINRDSSGNAITREATTQSVVGGETREGVSIGNSSTRGDLNETGEPSVVTVANSTDLNALAQAIAVASFGEDLLVSNSNFSAGGGVNIDAGTIFERTLTLQNTTIAADIIKARGYNNNGLDALVIDGGRFDGGRLVRLYAEGVSTLRFRGDVEINSPISQFAGSTVQIDSGSTVRTSGDVRVHADRHNYDGPGFGTLEAGGTKTRTDFNSRSRY